MDYKRLTFLVGFFILFGALFSATYLHEPLVGAKTTLSDTDKFIAVGYQPKKQIDDYFVELVKVGTYGDNGIEVYARVWDKNDKQIGFGTDGTVDIERFIIINRSPLVISKTEQVGEEIRTATGTETVYHTVNTYKEDAREAIYEALVSTIRVKKEKFSDEKIKTNKEGHTTTTIYSDSGDGYVGDSNANWATLHAAATGANIDYTSATSQTRMAGSYFSGSTYKLYRAFFSFDTSSIGSDSISSATFTIYASASSNNAGTPEYTVVEGTQAGTTVLVAGDYDNIGSTEYIDSRVAITSGTPASKDFVFNSTGISAINGSGTTKLAIRTDLDFDNSTPVDTTSETNGLVSYSEVTGTTEDPILVIEHTASAVDEPDQSQWF